MARIRRGASTPSTRGERWTAEHPDYYRAAVMLAELVGFDPEE